MYKSKNLKKWNYVSAFGKGMGQQPCQYECPDFFQLPVNGDKKKMKWVMTMNINPGCWFGGSATEYFVGDFDGKKFTCPDANEVKWLDRVRITMLPLPSQTQATEFWVSPG